MAHGNTSASRTQSLNRRAFAAGALAFSASPFAARAQQQPARRKLVAVVSTDSPESGARRMAAFLAVLRDYGWVEGRQFDLVQRYAGAGQLERVPALAGELAALKPDVFFFGVSAAVIAAREEIGVTPTVSANGDLVALGLAESYRRPGGNVTGVISFVEDSIPGKRFQLLQEAVHGAKRIGVIHNSTSPIGRMGRPAIEAAAAALDITLVAVDLWQPEDLEPAFETFARERVEALYVDTGAISYALRDKVAALELAARLPAIHLFAEEVEAGSLMAYGPSVVDNFRRAAFLVHKVLSGTHPSELPMDVQPRIFLTINLKTAKALGITLPESILVRASEFIE
jgi:putative tryptophan/tyrosine transport system substrate-binding protein